MRTVVVDTGPIVASLHRRDRYHEWAWQVLSELPAPLLTCEAVLSEACFLLRRIPRGQEAVLELLARGLLRVPFRLADEQAAVAGLLRRYASVPMSLADACLVRMTEQLDDVVLVTLDSDFRIYRRHGRRTVPVRMPDRDR